jgi:hypothetical protein
MKSFFASRTITGSCNQFCCTITNTSGDVANKNILTVSVTIFNEQLHIIHTA